MIKIISSRSHARNLLQAMILHDQLEKRRLERSTSENGADIRRPMISGLHHTSITPPGWVTLSLRWSVGQLPDPRVFSSKQTSASLSVCHWYCDTNCHGSLHIYIRILACVHVHYRGWQSIFTAIWSPHIWRVSRSSYRPRSNRYTRSKLQRVPLRWWTATIRGRSITYRRTGNFALDQQKPLSVRVYLMLSHLRYSFTHPYVRRAW